MAAPEHLILHGLEGSGPDHWQSWLARRLDAVAYPDLPDAVDRGASRWLAALRAELDRAERARRGLPLARLRALAPPRGDAGRPTAPRRARACSSRRPAPAPASRRSPLLPRPRDARGGRGGRRRRDAAGLLRRRPLLPRGRGARLRRALACPVDLIAGGGHLNPDAGYGPWPAVEAWVRGERADVVA